MNYQNHGEIEIEGCDEANVPVNSFLLPPDDECPQWRWTADNFMPRKSRVACDQYEIRADSREPLMEAVQKHVVPLYESALENLKTQGGNYYWERENPLPNDQVELPAPEKNL